MRCIGPLSQWKMAKLRTHLPGLDQRPDDEARGLHEDGAKVEDHLERAVTLPAVARQQPEHAC